MKLSVIIPSYKDPLLHKTINSLLESSHLGDQLEVIPVLDGYWPETPVVSDDRVNIIHVGKNSGMREAINYGVSLARGEFIMRTDEHCMFAPGYDVEMTNACEENWIMTATRYFLDPVKWERMNIPPVVYEKLKVRSLGNKAHKFEGVNWKSREKERANIMIDETTAMQGSMWLMPKAWWEKVIVRLETEGYGTMYQDSHEMHFKTWKAGGKVMVNKNTWFAHKHVKFPRTHHYSRKDWEPCVIHAYETWKDYFEEIRGRWGI